MIKKRQLVVEAGDEVSLRPNCSTLSPRNLRTDRGNCPFMTF
jgi:hypothetical protein